MNGTKSLSSLIPSETDVEWARGAIRTSWSDEERERRRIVAAVRLSLACVRCLDSRFTNGFDVEPSKFSAMPATLLHTRKNPRSRILSRGDSLLAHFSI